jgi:hypothetical protein
MKKSLLPLLGFMVLIIIIVSFFLRYRLPVLSQANSPEPILESKLFQITKSNYSHYLYVDSKVYGFTLTVPEDLVSKKGLKIRETGDDYIGIYMVGGSGRAIRGSEFGEGIHMILKAQYLDTRTLKQVVIDRQKLYKENSHASEIKEIITNSVKGYSFEAYTGKEATVYFFPLDNKRYLYIVDMSGTFDSTDKEIKALATSIIYSLYIHPSQP